MALFSSRQRQLMRRERGSLHLSTRVPRLAEIESKKAKERMIEAHSTGTQNFAELGETRKKVADAVGINRETLRQASKINENRELFDPEEFKDWDDGKSE